MKKMTIYQMAKKAGVSIATISRAMNPNTRHKVSPPTRAKIDQLIEKHGYTPNVAAQNLSRASSRAIGVLVPQQEGLFTNDFYARILSGVSDALIGSGYQFKLVMLPVDGKNWEQHNFKFGEGVDGLVVAHWPYFFSNKSFVKKIKIPVAIINDWDKGLTCHRVSCDNENGGSLVAEYLLNRGHKNIAVLSGPKWSTDSHSRLQGFKDVLKKKRVKFDAAQVISANYKEDEATQKVKLFLTSKKKTSAIFCLNDAMAIGAIRGIQELGLSCPKQVSVIGFDDAVSAQWHSPKLTTVHHPIYEMAKGATQILLSDLNRKNKVKKRHYVEQVFPVRLVERQSVAKL